MTTMLVRRRNGLLPELADVSWFPFLEPVIRIEEFLKDGEYVVRAELPGIDPAKDVEITARDGTLRIVLVRMEEDHDGGRTEFRYGTFHRSIALPAGAQEDTIKAEYTDGVLRITMTVDETKPIGKPIPIAVIEGKGKKDKS